MNYTQRPIPALLITATPEGEAAVLLQRDSREELLLRCVQEEVFMADGVQLQHHAVCFWWHSGLNKLWHGPARTKPTCLHFHCSVTWSLFMHSTTVSSRSSQAVSDIQTKWRVSSPRPARDVTQGGRFSEETYSQVFLWQWLRNNKGGQIFWRARSTDRTDSSFILVVHMYESHIQRFETPIEATSLTLPPLQWWKSVFSKWICPQECDKEFFPPVYSWLSEKSWRWTDK